VINVCNKDTSLYILIDAGSYESEALVVLQDQLQVPLKDLFVFVLGQQQHVEAGMCSRKV